MGSFWWTVIVVGLAAAFGMAVFRIAEGLGWI